jgi:putative tricarboxylic transport membrane protein
MDAFSGLMYGLSVCFVPINLFSVLIGVVVGTLVGVLPGLGPVGAIALLLPITMKLPAETSLIMLAGIYYGSMYGGSTTSILINVPGEAASVPTAIDGYQMAKKGRAGAALAIAALGSFIAGTLGVIGLMFFAPTLAKFALSFGPPEFFAIALLGLATLSRLSGGPLWQGLLVLAFGLALATIGMDPVSSFPRYTMGVNELTQGIELVPVVMGLYGIGEVLFVAEKAGGLPQITKLKFRELFPNREELRRSWPAILRGTGVGFIWGLIPGPSPILSAFTSYNLEQRISKNKDEFGKGAIEGVAGPESANNAATDGAMVPMLSLGVPFTPGTAMLLAALVIQGIQPGPMLITERPEVFWGVVASLYIGNVALLILNLPLVGFWISILRIPQSILVALIIMLTLLGAYTINNSGLDLIVLLVMGVVGYILRKIDFDISPMVLALVLGPMLESTFRQSLYLNRGDPWVFFQRPISAILLCALLAVFVLPPVLKLFKKRSAQGY